VNNIETQLRNDTAFGFVDRALPSSQVFHPLLVSNRGTNTMVKAIRAELRRSQSFTFSVAFVSPSAVAMLKQAFLDFDGRGTIITSTYLGFNAPAAFWELLNLPNVDVYVHEGSTHGFHAKGYVFAQESTTTAIVGSSNLTDNALVRNHEWNLRFSALPEGDVVEQLRAEVDEQLARSVRLTPGWIERYASQWTPPEMRPLAVDPLHPAEHIQPNAMQREALAEIEAVRQAGEKRALVVSATGTGKTILAALDVRAFNPERMLFIVHREQILDRAIEEFQKVLEAPRSDFGKFVGAEKQLDRKYVFATDRSLANPETLAQLDPSAFDYVLVDEVHRAGAAGYRRILEHLQPTFLLGVTATPERTDDFNVYELFDFNVPYEIRLQKALNEDMLAPFHYYGVKDFERDGEVIDDFAQLGSLVDPARIDHIIEALETYGHAGVPVRGLVFCSRKAEAVELSQLLNEREVRGKRLRTRSLTGEDPVAVREEAVAQLERGELDYIVTVDVFNEGIDIPSVNQVVMLRQTESSIIFTQQLGRGLRKAAGKDHLVVIDFIGNYTNNYLIPIALFGNNSLNKDSVRRDLIEAQEAGAIAGLSSVNFDKVSQERIFDSLATAKLDSLKAIKETYRKLRDRMGRAPQLYDFARFDLADPVVVATAGAERNYWSLVKKFKGTDRGPSVEQAAALRFLSAQVLDGKRPHELLLLRELLKRLGEQGHTGSAAGMSAAPRISEVEFAAQLRECDLSAGEEVLRSLRVIFSLEFFTDTERPKYGRPVVEPVESGFALSPEFAGWVQSDAEFAVHVNDVVETGLYLARHRYSWSDDLEVGKRYSRKDVCRLLNWKSDQKGTIYGYKVDLDTQTCPIFITYHKHDEVSASTAYEDEFLNESQVRWFTRSKRTLQSAEVKTIVENRVPLHLFAKKDDAEGTDFYYLGQARSSDPVQTKMPDGKGQELDVVTMTLSLGSAIEDALYEYLTARI
jgi:superfamily II DNA or RNA helicase/HKD family nuclease